MRLHDWQALNRDYKYTSLPDEIFSSKCAWRYNFNGTELDTKHINNASKTHKEDFKIMFICPTKSDMEKLLSTGGCRVWNWMKYAPSSIMHKIAAVYFLWICRKTSQKSWHTTNDYICQFSKLEIYTSSSLSSPSLLKQRGELTFPLRTTFLVLVICQCSYRGHKQPGVCKWHIQECSQRIVLCHGLISKTWESHQWEQGVASAWEAQKAA